LAKDACYFVFDALQRSKIQSEILGFAGPLARRLVDMGAQ
jgi:hypothetical protein